MQHVFGHGNLGNECADHAAALGTFGLISNHNVVTRWIRHRTLTLLSVLMAVTTSVRLLNVHNTFEQMLRRSTKTEFNFGTSHPCSVCPVCTTCHSSLCGFLCRSQVSAFLELFPYQQVMDRLLESSISNCSS